MSASLASHLFAVEFGWADDPPSGGSTTRHQTARLPAALAERVRRGDETAFAEMFNVLYPPLVRFAERYCKSKAMAEDAVQDVFAKVWQHRTELIPRVSISAYFYNAVRNRVLNLVAHENVVELHSSDATTAMSTFGFPVGEEPSPDELLLANELVALAAARVSTLSPRLREIYRMSREDDLTPAEIAEALGTTTQTIYVQLGRIMRALYPTLATWFDRS